MLLKIFETHAASKDLAKVPKNITTAYKVWARLIESHGVSILRDFKGYHDEKLSGILTGYRSSRLNKKWRVIYKVTHQGTIEIVEVRRVVPHEYRL